MSPERASGVADVEALRGSWLQLVLAFGVEAGPAWAAFTDLAERYSAPERHYHNLDHLADMLRIVDSLRDAAQDLAAVRFAVWFHDAVYDSRANDNEERSAVLALDTLRSFGVPEDTVVRTADLIQLTKTHLAAAPDVDGHILLDADLAILGADPVRYGEYAAAIRREYDWVPEKEYRAGRARVLRRFLERPRLYYTERLFASLETQARANLKGEIDRLVAS
jgi:predicted metal-dependent HD superfamily phosphohydrolase